MSTDEQISATTPTSAPGEKRAYHAPQVTDLGDVRTLTRSGGGSGIDGLRSHAPKG
jgi:hypothetical protein